MKILSLTYLGNIRYYQKLLAGDAVIDLGEHYIKQSYRTRCEILTSSGVLPLSLQVVKPSNRDKPAMRDIRLDYSKRWQHRHWNSLVAAYQNSPYFDYLGDIFEPFYRRRFEFLVDLNIGLLEEVLKIIGRCGEVRYSESYIEAGEGDEDLRDAISPKPRLAKPDPSFIVRPYTQVFGEEFVPNLSIIDTLMCCGPRAGEVVRI